MLPLPSKASRRGGSSLDILCDWVEATVLFDEEWISKADVRDELFDEQICSKNKDEDDERADSIVADVWGRLKSRQILLGPQSPIVFNGDRIERRKGKKWTDYPAYAYCMLVSYAFWHPALAKTLGGSYIQQGELFEELTKEAVSRMFPGPGWQLLPTGWTTAKPEKMSQVVKNVAEFLGDTVRDGEVKKWTSKNANEAGLDLVLLHRFSDRQGWSPLLFFQCASGGNWLDKTSEPNIEAWKGMISLSYFPQKALASPFSLLEDDHHHKLVGVGGMVVDRYRLLSDQRAGKAWISASLQRNLMSWLKPRVAKAVKH